MKIIYLTESKEEYEYSDNYGFFEYSTLQEICSLPKNLDLNLLIEYSLDKNSIKIDKLLYLFNHNDAKNDNVSTIQEILINVQKCLHYELNSAERSLFVLDYNISSNVVIVNSSMYHRIENYNFINKIFQENTHSCCQNNVLDIFDLVISLQNSKNYIADLDALGLILKVINYQNFLRYYIDNCSKYNEQQIDCVLNFIARVIYLSDFLSSFVAIKLFNADFIKQCLVDFLNKKIDFCLKEYILQTIEHLIELQIFSNNNIEPDSDFHAFQIIFNSQVLTCSSNMLNVLLPMLQKSQLIKQDRYYFFNLENSQIISVSNENTYNVRLWFSEFYTDDKSIQTIHNLFKNNFILIDFSSINCSMNQDEIKDKMFFYSLLDFFVVSFCANHLNINCSLSDIKTTDTELQNIQHRIQGTFYSKSLSYIFFKSQLAGLILYNFQQQNFLQCLFQFDKFSELTDNIKNTVLSFVLSKTNCVLEAILMLSKQELYEYPVAKMTYLDKIICVFKYINACETALFTDEFIKYSSYKDELIAFCCFVACSVFQISLDGEFLKKLSIEIKHLNASQVSNFIANGQMEIVYNGYNALLLSSFKYDDISIELLKYLQKVFMCLSTEFNSYIQDTKHINLCLNKDGIIDLKYITSCDNYFAFDVNLLQNLFNYIKKFKNKSFFTYSINFVYLNVLHYVLTNDDDIKNKSLQNIEQIINDFLKKPKEDIYKFFILMIEFFYTTYSSNKIKITHDIVNIFFNKIYELLFNKSNGANINPEDSERFYLCFQQAQTGTYIVYYINELMRLINQHVFSDDIKQLQENLTELKLFFNNNPAYKNLFYKNLFYYLLKYYKNEMINLYCNNDDVNFKLLDCRWFLVKFCVDGLVENNINLDEERSELTQQFYDLSMKQCFSVLISKYSFLAWIKWVSENISYSFINKYCIGEQLIYVKNLAKKMHQHIIEDYGISCNFINIENKIIYEFTKVFKKFSCESNDLKKVKMSWLATSMYINAHVSNEVLFAITKSYLMQSSNPFFNYSLCFNQKFSDIECNNNIQVISNIMQKQYANTCVMNEIQHFLFDKSIICLPCWFFDFTKDNYNESCCLENCSNITKLVFPKIGVDNIFNENIALLQFADCKVNIENIAFLRENKQNNTLKLLYLFYGIKNFVIFLYNNKNTDWQGKEFAFGALKFKYNGKFILEHDYCGSNKLIHVLLSIFNNIYDYWSILQNCTHELYNETQEKILFHNNIVDEVLAFYINRNYSTSINLNDPLMQKLTVSDFFKNSSNITASEVSNFAKNYTLPTPNGVTDFNKQWAVEKFVLDELRKTNTHIKDYVYIRLYFEIVNLYQDFILTLQDKNNANIDFYTVQIEFMRILLFNEYNFFKSINEIIDYIFRLVRDNPLYKQYDAVCGSGNFLEGFCSLLEKQRIVKVELSNNIDDKNIDIKSTDNNQLHIYEMFNN